MSTNSNNPRAARQRLPRLKPNQPSTCIGKKVHIEAGRSFVWHAEDGYPALILQANPGGPSTLWVNYLGPHHRKMKLEDIDAEIKHRLTILTP